jgi:predicted phosphodiesterase
MRMVTSLRPEPRRVALAGDWHGVTNDAVRAIHVAADSGANWLVQLGDFGFWEYPESAYLDAIQNACETAHVRVAWIDGNHERFPLIDDITRVKPSPHPHAVAVRPRVYYLPRGFRWTWQGHRWLAVGGATSLDRGRRLEGVDWWPDEEISHREVAAIIADGHADVMVCHDGPASTTPKFDPFAVWPPAELARAQQHRQRVQRIMDAAQPEIVLHGHFHLSYVQRVRRPWGASLVIGLDHGGRHGSNHMVVLDAFDLTWQEPSPPPGGTV